jgi:hypothetical protein
VNQCDYENHLATYQVYDMYIDMNLKKGVCMLFHNNYI